MCGRHEHRLRLPLACRYGIGALILGSLSISPLRAEPLEESAVQISIGHDLAESTPFYVHLVASGGVELRTAGTWKGTAGAGHVETQSFKVAYPKIDVKPIQDLQVIWAYLIAHSDADTVRRLTLDPGWRPDPRKITVELDAEGTLGFTFTIDQLLQNKTLWVPSLHTFITLGNSPTSFSDNQRQIEPYKTNQILNQVHHDPEASYEEFKNKWQDMGSPDYSHPVQEGPGHIVGLGWDGSIPKFGIDRGAGVWNDLGNPDHFRFWFEFGNLVEGIRPYWKNQTLAEGLPVMTTVFERDRVRYEVEQFAYPLNGPPSGRTGELHMVLLERVRMTNLAGTARVVPVTMVHERSLPAQKNVDVKVEQEGGQALLTESTHHDVLLAVKAPGTRVVWAGVTENGQKTKRADITVSVPLSANGTLDFYVTLPSPVIHHENRVTLEGLNYDIARANTLKFWSSYLARGATFRVPEKAVNDLFRANLWHALRLPRIHDDGNMDLPYTNFGYGQIGTPWPINQAVYVDYMLYGLRGYNAVATEEIEAIYRNNQESNGRVGGNADWLAYTPGMLYAVAQNYLLSGDRKSFEKVLPDTLKALDWSIQQIRDASKAPGRTLGLVAGPLNDITGSGYWAFNQAYLYAGVNMMGKALAMDGNPRAKECLEVAEEYRAAIERSMRIATVDSPLVQLRDHSWIPYVPSDAARPGRNFVQWYPSDVDTGATHLLRLKALPAQGELADALLADHEDNLYLHGWGLANEPVYDQQATAYLLRDDAKAVIRTFYSLMAGGFSHGVYEPVEHRWRWGQYFGPPSTDGAWFELYRNMLIREVDSDTLLLAQATPRVWLEDGKKIVVKDAPTWFGNISLEIQSHAADGSIHASFQLDSREQGKTVLFRLRHPQGKSLRRVTVNGSPWDDFDAKKEWVRIPNVGQNLYLITANY